MPTVRQANPGNLAQQVSLAQAGDTIVLAASSYYAWYWPSVANVTFQAADHYEYMAVYKTRGHDGYMMGVKVYSRNLGEPSSQTFVLGVYFDFTSSNTGTQAADINSIVYHGESRVVWRDCAFKGRPTAGTRAILRNYSGVPAGANHMDERCRTQSAGKYGDEHDHAYYANDGAWSGAPWTSTPAATIRECIVSNGGEYAIQFYRSPEGWLWDRNISYKCNHGITFSSETGYVGARYNAVTNSVLSKMTNSRGDSWAAMVESYDPTNTVANNRLWNNWIGDTGGQPRIASTVTSARVNQAGNIGSASASPGYADPDNGDFTITTSSQLYVDAQAAGLVGQIGPASIWPGFVLPGGGGTNQVPNASMSISPGATAGQPVTFTDTSSDPDGYIAARAWDLDNDGAFDDGTGATATRTFPAAGTYTVRLQVTDNQGATAVATRTVTVAAAPSNQAPAVTITSSPAVVGAPVTLTATATDPDGTITSIEWDLNDDGVYTDATGTTATMTWPTAGDRVVRARATDNQGAVTTASRTVTVSPPPPSQPAVTTKAGSAAAPTAPGTQTVTLGWTPKAVLIWGTGDSAEGDTPGGRMIIGAATASGQWGYGWASDTATSGSRSSRVDSRTQAVVIPNGAAGGIAAAASCALTADGFTLTWTVVTPGAGVQWLAIGGTGVQATSGVAPLATTAGVVTTTTGFQPAVVLACHDVTPVDGQVIPSLNLGWGAATAAAQHSVTIRDTNASNPTDLASLQQRDALVTGLSSYSLDVIARGRLTAMNPTGFDITWDAGTAAGEYGWIALGGLYATVGATNQSASSSAVPTLDHIGLLAAPALYGAAAAAPAGASQTIPVDHGVAAIMWSNGLTQADGVDTTTARFGVGATDGSTNAAAWIQAADNQATAATARRLSQRSTITGAPGVDAKATLTGTGGVRVTWGQNSPTPAPTVGYLILASQPTTTTPPPPPSGGGTTPPGVGEWMCELVSHSGDRVAYLPGRARTFTTNRNAGGTAGFTMTTDEAAGVQGLTVGTVDMLITLDGEAMWRGPLETASGDITATTGLLQFTAAPVEALLATRFIPAGREILATEQTAMAWQLIEDAQAGAGNSLGITRGTTPDSVARSKTWDTPTDVRSALDELVQADGGFDYTMVPTLTGYRFDARVPRGRETDLVWEWGRNIMAVGVSVDASQIRNQVTAVGQNQVQVVAADPDSILVHRLRQGIVTLGDAADPLWLGDQARGALVTSPLVLPRLRLQPGAPDARYRDIRVGDIVTVRVNRGWVTLDGRYRVEQITVTLPDAPGAAEAMDIVVAPQGVVS